MNYHCDDFRGADVGSLPPLEIDNEAIISEFRLNVNTNNNQINELWSGALDVKPEHRPDPTEDLLPFCVAKNTITNFFAPAGSGKSFLVVAIARTALLSDRIKEVWYIDADNSLQTIFQRDLLKIVRENKNFHYVSLNNPNIPRYSGLQIVKDQIINSKRDLKDILVVFDSLKDFTADYDIMKDSDMREFFGMFMTIRDYQNATVIFLSHTNKEGSTYKGSTSVIDSIETAYLVHPKNRGDAAKKSGYLDYYLEGVKAREGGLCVWCRVDAVEKHIYVEGLDYQGYEKERDRRLIEKIAVIIRNHPGIPLKTLFQKVGRSRRNKKFLKILNDFVGNMWVVKVKNRQKCYWASTPIMLETLYENKKGAKDE